MSSRTWSGRVSTLVRDKELASIVLRLMMALNDIGVANDGLRQWTETTDPRMVVRQAGGRLYYGRMLMSRLFEALDIVEDLGKSVIQGHEVEGKRFSFPPMAMPKRPTP